MTWFIISSFRSHLPLTLIIKGSLSMKSIPSVYKTKIKDTPWTTFEVDVWINTSSWLHQIVLNADISRSGSLLHLNFYANIKLYQGNMLSLTRIIVVISRLILNSSISFVSNSLDKVTCRALINSWLHLSSCQQLSFIK